MGAEHLPAGLAEPDPAAGALALGKGPAAGNRTGLVGAGGAHDHLPDVAVGLDERRQHGQFRVEHHGH